MIQVARWKKPSASVLASRPATVVLGCAAVPVSMWCHCRIWWSTIPSMNPPSPMPRRKEGDRMACGLPGPGAKSFPTEAALWRIEGCDSAGQDVQHPIDVGLGVVGVPRRAQPAGAHRRDDAGGLQPLGAGGLDGDDRRVARRQPEARAKPVGQAHVM